MTDPLDMRLDHAMTPLFGPQYWIASLDSVRVSVPNPYWRMRFRRYFLPERPPKPKQLAGVMLGPECRRQWQQALAPFEQLDRSGMERDEWLGWDVFSPAKSVQQRALFEVWASVSRGQFIHTWQFAVRGKP